MIYADRGVAFSFSVSTRVAKDFYIKFVPSEWLSDKDLRRCSLAARGAWIDMLCMMFQCDEVGVLVSAGVPWTVEDVCAALGGPTDFTRSCVEELLAKGVAARDNRNAIFSRRMVYEANLSRKRAEAGSIGGRRAQEILLEQKSKQTSSKPQANVEQNSNYSSNSDSESGFTLSGEIPKRAREKSKPPDIPPELASPEFESAWADWLAMRREKRKESTPTSQRVMLKKLASMGRDRAIKALRYSVENGWIGIFEPRENDNGQTSGRSSTSGGASGDRGTAPFQGDPRRSDQFGASTSRLARAAIRIGVAGNPVVTRAPGGGEGDGPALAS